MKIANTLQAKGKELRSIVENLKPFSMIIIDPAKRQNRLHKQTHEQFKFYHPKKITIH